MNTKAPTPPITPIAANPTRQPKKSVSTPVIKRPPNPPAALPPMYKPIPSPMDSGCTSSLRYVMATEGSPPKVRPSNVRSNRKVCQVGATAVSSTSTVDDSSDTLITAFRPQAFDTGPANNMANASTAHGSDSDKALVAALTSYCRLNSGMIGWTQYRNPKVATPDANMARFVRRKVAVPE